MSPPPPEMMGVSKVLCRDFFFVKKVTRSFVIVVSLLHGASHSVSFVFSPVLCLQGFISGHTASTAFTKHSRAPCMHSPVAGIKVWKLTFLQTTHAHSHLYVSKAAYYIDIISVISQSRLDYHQDWKHASLKIPLILSSRGMNDGAAW